MIQRKFTLFALPKKEKRKIAMSKKCIMAQCNRKVLHAEKYNKNCISLETRKKSTNKALNMKKMSESDAILWQHTIWIQTNKTF